MYQKNLWLNWNLIHWKLLIQFVAIHWRIILIFNLFLNFSFLYDKLYGLMATLNRLNFLVKSTFYYFTVSSFPLFGFSWIDLFVLCIFCPKCVQRSKFYIFIVTTSCRAAVGFFPLTREFFQQQFVVLLFIHVNFCQYNFRLLEI